jgi:hypothetical protein
MLALSVALLASPSLCWHHCPHYAGIAALILLGCCPCCAGVAVVFGIVLPCCPQLSTCHLNESKDACELTTGCKHNKSKVACATRVNNAGATKATTPLLCWWWCQCNKGDDAIVTMAKTPVHWGWQWHHCDKGNGTSLTMATTPLQWRQQHYCNNGKYAWTAKLPAHQGQQHNCNKGNKTSLTTEKTMPAHWYLQQLHCYKANNASLMAILSWLQ